MAPLTDHTISIVDNVSEHNTDIEPLLLLPMAVSTTDQGLTNMEAEINVPTTSLGLTIDAC